MPCVSTRYVAAYVSPRTSRAGCGAGARWGGHGGGGAASGAVGASPVRHREGPVAAAGELGMRQFAETSDR